jgi:hypothetical protein
MKQRTIYFLLALLGCITACTREAAIPLAKPISHTSFYNGSPDFYEIPNHVILNNDSVLRLSYNATATGPIGALNYLTYRSLPAGIYRLMFTDSGGIKNKLTDNLVNMQADKYQSVFLSDSLGYIEAITVVDDLERDEQMARIRLVHLSADAPRVTMVIDTTAVPGLDSIRFRQITPFVKVPPDENPGFRIRSIINGQAKTLIRKSFALLPGRSYTFILRGYVQARNDDPNKTINLSALINQ